MTYDPQYPILSPEDILPKDQIRLVPEHQLSPLDRAELIRLREGKVRYRVLVADTPENRQNLVIRTTYFQIVACKEGWEFDPNKYQVEFVDPNHFLLTEEGTQKRIWEFEEGAEVVEVEGISPERRAGFTIHGSQAERMGNQEADGLARRVLKFFK